MNEDRLAEQIGKAQRASALLNDEAFTGAIDGIKAQLIERWQIAKDANERERIWLTVNLVEQVKQALVTTIANGSLSRRELEDLASGRTRKHFGVV
jgi:hypothetical protein